MNKKQYMAPLVETTRLHVEGMIADSLKIGTESGSQQLSDKKDFGGWDSESWNNTTEE